jgi:predicted P-loop ATPase
VFSNASNVKRVFDRCDDFRGFSFYDEFKQRIYSTWKTKKIHEITEADLINILIFLQDKIGLQNIKKEHVFQALLDYSHNHSINGPRDWFESLIWDGQPRISDFFPSIFGADPSPYTLAAGRNFWIAMIARIYEPGCQHDHVPMIYGKQGIGKSQAFRMIAGPEWFGEASFAKIHNPNYLQILQGRLIIEFADLAGLSRQDEEAVKKFITDRLDPYRTPYDRLDANHPRQCVFIGTTNRDQFSRDETGARRWWPIHCKGNVSLSLIDKYREQFFAEAVHCYKQKEKWHIMPTDSTIIAQESCREEDERESLISQYLVSRNSVTLSEVIVDCLKGNPLEISKHQISIGKCLRAIGFEKENNQKDVNGAKKRLWVRKNDI